MAGGQEAGNRGRRLGADGFVAWPCGGSVLGRGSGEWMADGRRVDTGCRPDGHQRWEDHQRMERRETSSPCTSGEEEQSRDPDDRSDALGTGPTSEPPEPLPPDQPLEPLPVEPPPRPPPPVEESPVLPPVLSPVLAAVLSASVPVTVRSALAELPPHRWRRSCIAGVVPPRI